MNTEQHRRKGLRIMGALIGLVKPLLPVMILAVVLGTIGYLCAIFLTVLAGYGLLRLAYMALGIELLPGQAEFPDTGARRPLRGAGDPGGAAGRAALRGTVLQPFYRV